MKKKRTHGLIISILMGILLTSCSGVRDKDACQWSKWYDNGDGTHSRHCVDDITVSQTESHHFEIEKTLIEPSDVAPGKASMFCSDCGLRKDEVLAPTGNYVFDQKRVEDKYLYKKCSEHSSIYYLSSIEGAYGNPEKLFEYSDIDGAYSEVEYVRSDGRQYIDTGVENITGNKTVINNSSKVMPTEYQQVEYITFTGTASSGQFFRTGVKELVHPYSVQVKYDKTNTDQRDQSLLGQRQIGKYPNICETTFETLYGDTENNTAPDNAITLVDTKSSDGFYCNGTQLISTTESSPKVTDYELLIGAFSEDSYENAKWFFNGNIYEIRIASEGNLLKHYVPCYRKLDSVVGLYEFVSNEFCTNIGNGDVLKGPDVEAQEEILPSEYQKLTYIESHGISSDALEINTGLKFDIDHDEMEIEYQSTVLNQNGMIFANNASSNYLWFYHYKDASWTALYVQGNGHEQERLGNIPLDTVKHTARYRNKTFYIDDNQLGTTETSFGETGSNMYLFSRGGSYYWSGKIFECRIWKNGLLARHYVPAERTSDERCGMYDFVSNTFVTSSGTANFIKGQVEEQTISRLPDEYQEVSYIESTGKEMISTGVIFNPGDNASQIVDLQQTKGANGLWCGADYYLQYAKSQERYFTDYKRHVLYQVFENHKLSTYLDGNFRQTEEFSGSEKENTPYYFFALGSKNMTIYASNPCPMRIFSAKIYKNNALVRDYVPCYNKLTLEAGLFDLVTNVFHGNNAEGALLKGADVFNPISGVRDDSSAPKRNIPSYFYQLNYVESFGYQSLDTKIVGPSRLELDVNLQHVGKIQTMGYDYKVGECFGVSATNKYSGTSITPKYIDHIIADFGEETENSLTLKINDNSPVNIDLGDISEKTLKLFDSDEKHPCFALLFGAKVYQNNVLVRDYVPVMYRESMEAGLYDLVEQKFYVSSAKQPLKAGGLMYEGINNEHINVFCSRNSNTYCPSTMEVNNYKVYNSGNKVIRDMVPVIRNSDSKPGFYDVVNQVFYTPTSEFELEAGPVVSHILNEGTISKQPVFNDDGEIIYTCSICGAHIKDSISRLAYKVTFLPDDTSITAIKIFQTNDPRKFSESLVGYTRNQNTFNYSKYKASIEFEVPNSGDKEYEIVCSNGKVKELENGHYQITSISADIYVNIRLK